MTREEMIQDIHTMVAALDDVGLEKLMHDLRGEEEQETEE